MAYLDFYCNASTGNNINGGDSEGSSIYTSTNGNWNSSTNVFTPTDGTNPVSAGVAVGQFCSIYNDGATVAVFIVKITAVTNAANGAITVSGSQRAGSPPTTSATARSITVRGAWKGPNAASGWPFSQGSLASLCASGDRLCVNMKNNATYSITAGINQGSGTAYQTQGYSSTVRDGGKAIIDGGTSGSAYTIFSASASNGFSFVDLIFDHNGATGTQTGVNGTNATGTSFKRCVFRNMRGTGASVYEAYECEAYGNNTGTATNGTGFNCSSNAVLVRCYSHDNGNGGFGYYFSTSGVNCTFINCIADSNGGDGFRLEYTNCTVTVSGCDAYNNGGDGLQIGNGTTASIGTFIVENCNFVKNTGWGINGSPAYAGTGFFYNNGFGTGTQANGSGTKTGLGTGLEVGSVNYSSGATPWNAPATGDFKINLDTALSAGRGAFTQVDGTNTGSVGYPDIGAVQHQDLVTDVTLVDRDTFFPDGFINHVYTFTQEFIGPPTVTITTGSLPPGLSTTADATTHAWGITGTPTTAGTYTATIKVVSGYTTVQYLSQIVILADPDEGFGGMIGG